MLSPILTSLLWTVVVTPNTDKFPKMVVLTPSTVIAVFKDDV